MNLELVAIAGVLSVVAISVLAPRIGVAAPLLLVILGIGVALLPFVGEINVDPEWVLGGLLPPLLYSAAVNTPTMEFRRDFRLISAFSVVLVAVTAVVIGLLATLVLPGLPLGLGIALGAIIQPDRRGGNLGHSQGRSLAADHHSGGGREHAQRRHRLGAAALGGGSSRGERQLVPGFGAVRLVGTGCGLQVGYLVGKLGLLARSKVEPVTSSVTATHWSFPSWPTCQPNISALRGW